MDFALTHEHADFDAIAALYAASLVFDVRPILPRRINKNVRAFIALYGLDNAFVDHRDIPSGAIDSITLVDTQTSVTVKGMGKGTRIRIFDHHPQKTHTKKQKENWSDKNKDTVMLELGATTTYFVELLQEKGLLLTSSQSTLLLLGIYEDTGTLTYSNTTFRDVYAVGWLLEQNAELDCVNSFLNPPLNLQQRDLYEHLIESKVNLDINGHRIIIASGILDDPAEEVSILAHKLRDLLDPDALFVLVGTGDSVRMVARSANNQIDVSHIAMHFNGGGHSRAAAALIQNESSEINMLAFVYKELVSILPKYINPAITVAQLMSKHPHVISANAPVVEAARLMTRYGYEGFPVVEGGKLVGLLTRRAVDRAITHKINLTASDLMDTGAITVFPCDSLQHLQAVMTESGWGQIPVIEPETLKIIGIVTRTDLLKILSRSQPVLGKPRSLSARLDEILEGVNLELIHSVADGAIEEHYPVFVVGGFVRDLLLNYPSGDFDIVVEGDAIVLGNKLVSKYGGRLTTHTRFGTARWYISDTKFEGGASPKYLDLISARQEFYEHPSALPTVEHSSIKLDLHRRDFTINTLALRLDGRFYGELIDHYGGLKDLERQCIRVLHSLSFVDDPTRMLRAVRYEQRYRFSIEPRTLQLIGDASSLLAHLSPERVRHELDLILIEQNSLQILDRLDALGLIKKISEYLDWNIIISKRIEKLKSSLLPSNWGFDNRLEGFGSDPTLNYCLWLLDYSNDRIEKIRERLQLPIYTVNCIKAAAALYSDIPSLLGTRPSDWVDRLDGLPILAVYAVFLITGEESLEKFVLSWKKIIPNTNGNTLKKMGLIPGKYFQDILHTLRCAWVNGEIDNLEAEENLLNLIIRFDNN